MGKNKKQCKVIEFVNGIVIGLRYSVFGGSAETKEPQASGSKTPSQLQNN